MKLHTTVKLHTRHDEAAEYVRVWGRARASDTPEVRERCKLLGALGPNPKPNEVERVMGLNCCSVACDGCDGAVERVVVMKLDVCDWMPVDVHLCEECLERALSLMRAGATDG